MTSSTDSIAWSNTFEQSQLLRLRLLRSPTRVGILACAVVCNLGICVWSYSLTLPLDRAAMAAVVQTVFWVIVCLLLPLVFWLFMAAIGMLIMLAVLTFVFQAGGFEGILFLIAISVLVMLALGLIVWLGIAVLVLLPAAAAGSAVSSAVGGTGGQALGVLTFLLVSMAIGVILYLVHKYLLPFLQICGWGIVSGIVAHRVAMYAIGAQTIFGTAKPGDALDFSRGILELGSRSGLFPSLPLAIWIVASSLLIAALVVFGREGILAVPREKPDRNRRGRKSLHLVTLTRKRAATGSAVRTLQLQDATLDTSRLWIAILIIVAVIIINLTLLFITAR